MMSSSSSSSRPSSACSGTGYHPFDQHNDEYRRLIRQIEAMLYNNANKDKPNNDNDNDNPNDDEKIWMLLQQCQDLLFNMKLEARGAPDDDYENYNLKRELLDIYQACLMQLESYKAIMDKKELFFSATTTRTATNTSTTKNTSGPSLTLNNSSRNSTTDRSFKERLLSTRNQAMKQQSHLEKSLRSIRETEEIAGGITTELGRNRQKLQNTESSVEKLSGMMEQANGHLKNLMNKRWFW